ncbi:hypothetical protein CGRA01v4_05558 [Colletotrichum graminicola]|uniref:Uncharacterized protein n=1 Tax=Colletotrichum graminicola (strain M1.001 / M2 / FGSC 10212) TaxID=645133 RepID=E3Q6H3_COLGM|nr:uncharacterized protein GLRG_01565 [Colletotrichum graminicola M1.001]EFQ26421.1 hypothetical protein GLRG_01565 [Colletotrichum graminicola M1.001]WDK14277.1 hypothetical protein CGRA01v4_05558 [Colletotrichum graminicola]
MSGAEGTHANTGGFDLLKRATQAMMSGSSHTRSPIRQTEPLWPMASSLNILNICLVKASALARLSPLSGPRCVTPYPFA